MYPYSNFLLRYLKQEVTHRGGLVDDKEATEQASGEQGGSCLSPLDLTLHNLHLANRSLILGQVGMIGGILHLVAAGIDTAAKPTATGVGAGVVVDRCRLGARGLTDLGSLLQKVGLDGPRLRFGLLLSRLGLNRLGLGRPRKLRRRLGRSWIC